MGSESEALGWKHVFSAFHRAKMSTQDTQVNTVGCIFSSKNQTEYLKGDGNPDDYCVLYDRS